MNRRGFLQLLGVAGAIAATGLSLEELLEPERLIFLPAAPVIETLTIRAPLRGHALFVPELWSAEIHAMYKTNLILETQLASRVNRKYARLTNIGSYAIFEDRIRSYQGSL